MCAVARKAAGGRVTAHESARNGALAVGEDFRGGPDSPADEGSGSPENEVSKRNEQKNAAAAQK